jgi:hypothetical protein
MQSPESLDSSARNTMYATAQSGSDGYLNLIKMYQTIYKSVVQVRGLNYLLSGRCFKRQLHLAGIHSLRLYERRESQANSVYQLKIKTISRHNIVGSRRAFSAMQSESTDVSISYLGQSDAQKLDQDLMGPLGFSVDQLMEV